MIFSFFLEIFSTHFTSSKCLFHMNNHKDPAGWVISVESISSWTEPQGNIYKKSTILFFIIPRQGFFHFWKLLQNPGLKEMSGFPSSPIYLVRNWRSTALCRPFYYNNWTLIIQIGQERSAFGKMAHEMYPSKYPNIFKYLWFHGLNIQIYFNI